MVETVKNKICVISYYANLPGACQAEWIDDKLVSLKDLKKNVYFISSPSAHRYHHIKSHIKCSSLSWHDFKDEFERSVGEGHNVLALILFAPIAFLIGNVVDLLQKIVVKGVGEGRWSWCLTSPLAGLYQMAIYGRPDIILSTGGPASAHLTGLILGCLARRPVICELQDPLSGSDIGRNQRARGLLFTVEKLILKLASKVVYVTEGAAKNAKLTVNNEAQIEAIYPGSPKLVTGAIMNKSGFSEKNHLKLIHMGSLYATRNFDSLIGAIELLFEEIPDFSVEIVNLGHVEKQIADRLKSHSYIKIEPLRARQQALSYALTFDVLLLIQNTDERSQVTIPYKTYDYFNLNMLVLGLTNNYELDGMLKSAGHMACRVDNERGIADCIKYILENDTCLNRVNVSQLFDPKKSVERLISL